MSSIISYRDISGFIFHYNGEIYRQVNKEYTSQFERFVSGGLYETLVSKKLIIRHTLINENLLNSADWYVTLKPDRIETVSYPYEWSFSMLKDAALLTLEVARLSISKGIMLKDATPYNIQWHEGKLIFIDTLSFENYDEKKPWIAYRQFCEQFLAPLLLMHYNKQPLQQLLLAWPEGIPLKVAASLLPWRSRFSLYTYLHIHLNARYSVRQQQKDEKKVVFSKSKMLNLINSLESLVKRLRLSGETSTWSDYYREASSREDYLVEKKEILSNWISVLPGDVKSAIDVGSNTGDFSFLLSEKGISTVAADSDAVCIERLYRYITDSGEKNILPLVADFSNPSPGIGINNEERAPFTGRTQADIMLALAVIHHLAIGKNIPLHLVAAMFAAQTKKKLFIEFVPLSDEKTKILLSSKDIPFKDYTEDNFLKEFLLFFEFVEKKPISNSGRVLYHFNKKLSFEKKPSANQ